MKGLFFALVMTASFGAKADSTVSCQVMSVARCICAASIYVDCQGLGQGFIADATKATSITFANEENSQHVSLAKPKEILRNYYAPSETSEIKKLAKKAGIKNFQSLMMISVEVPSTTKLYQNPEMQDE
jgi:hypothetical protein